jgi:hypothetical protein
MTDITLDPINSGYNLSKINDNFDKIESNINTTSIQSTGGNNVMDQDFDMNSNQILNLPKPVNPTDVVRLQDLTSSGSADAGKTFATLDALIASDELDVLASTGGRVQTAVNNIYSMTGGASYRINTLAQERIDRNDPTWVPDGAVSTSTSYNGTTYLGGVTVGADHYVGGGTEYVAILCLDGGQPWDAQFGTVGTDKHPTGIYDDFLALEKFFEYCRTNRDGGRSGGYVPYISPRSTFWISDTIDLIDFFTPVNWNGTDLFPISPITCINYESVGSEMSSIFIRYGHLPTEAVYNAQKAAITFSGGQPSNVNSETVFNNLNRVLIYNPWRGIELNSFDDNNGGLIWQSAFDEVTVWNAIDWGFYLYSVEQVSTTTAFRSCHTKNVFQDTVQHAGAVYYAIRHMTAASPIEPGVTAGWENYWRVKESANGVPTVPSTEAAWTTGTFYRTNGKGYYINNVQTCAFYNCSADGSNTTTSGCIIYALNSVVTIDAFHLEGARMTEPDVPFFDMNCDLIFGTLYMYDLQMNLPDGADRAPLIGGSLGRGRVGELLNVRNHTQNVVRKGNFDMFRMYSNGAKDFGRLHTGIGVPPDLVTGKEYSLFYTSAQWSTDYRQPDDTFVMSNNTAHYKLYETTIPDVGEAEPTYIEFNDILEVTVNSGNNTFGLGKTARVRISVFVQSGAAPDKVYFDLEQVSGNGEFIYYTFNTTTRLLEIFAKCDAAGQSAMSKLYGKNSGFESGTPYKDGSVSRLLETPVEIANATVTAQEGYDAVPLGRQATKTITTTHTITNGDSGYWLIVNDAGDGAVTIPDGLKKGTSLLVTNIGAGGVTVAMGGSETLRGATALSDADGFMSLTKIANTVWQASERV